MKISRVLQFAGGIVIAGLGMAIFFRNVNFNSLWSEIQLTKVWAVIVGGGLGILSLYFRSLRWKVILPVREKTSHCGFFSLVTISFMVNNILPARMGEPVRALLLWRRNGYTVAESIGSLFVERCIDVLTFVSFFFVPVFFNAKLVNLHLYAIIAGSIFCTTLCGMIFYALNPGLFRGLFTFVLTALPGRIRPWVLKVGNELLSNMDWIFSPGRVLRVFVLSYMTSFCYVFIMVLLTNQFPTFGLLEGMFGLSFAAMGASIPLTPGFVGTLHTAILHALTLLGLSVDKAQAVAILYHGIPYVAVTSLGLFFLIGTNITFKDISGASEELGKKED